jgi:hypothetical protein
MEGMFFHTSERMPEIADASARLVFMSPPFTNNPDGRTLDKSGYLAFLDRVMTESVRTLLPGGVLVSLNTDLRDHARYNHGDASYDGTVWHKHLAIRNIAEHHNLSNFDHKIWAKSLKENMYRFSFSHILFYQKSGRRLRPHGRKHAWGFGPDVWLLEDSMQRRDSKGYTFPDAIHPKIVRRCIDEFTQEGDLVVSPFTGSGTILAVANDMGRRWVGYEINKRLKRLIRESVSGPNRPGIYSLYLVTE